jgi:hypothetical protein
MDVRLEIGYATKTTIMKYKKNGSFPSFEIELE